MRVRLPSCTGTALAVPVRCFLWLVALASVLASEPVPSASAPTLARMPDYRLFPGDLLKIEVFDNPDLTTQVRIPTSGGTSFPLVGDLGPLSGQPLAEMATQLQRRLEAKFLRQAVVTATVMEFGKRTIYVMGAVREPRAVELDPLRPVSAMQAISQAGGFQEDANRSGAQVVRDDAGRPGTKLALPVAASDSAIDLARDVALLPGDVIIVPRLDRVYVIGQVQKPGALNLPSQEVLTVSKAISLAGGFDRFAKQSDVQLVRSGQVSTIDVKGILLGERSADDRPLKPGDTVYVPESRF